MENLIYNNIWKLLESFDFRREVPTKFHCKLCKNVAINPNGSLCGCRFCLNCISNYLKNGKKECPGQTKMCKIELLDLNVNVTKNLSTIRDVQEFEVKCPYEMCEKRCRLGSMSDHIRVCVKSTVNCLYASMGCKGGHICKENLNTYYDEEWFTHSQMMMESFDNLKNEFIQLKKFIANKDEQINELTQDSKRQEIMLMEMNKKIKKITVLNNEDENRENELN